MTIFLYDDYNAMIRPCIVIGTVVPNFSRFAFKNGWKVIEVYDDFLA